MIHGPFLYTGFRKCSSLSILHKGREVSGVFVSDTQYHVGFVDGYGYRIFGQRGCILWISSCLCRTTEISLPVHAVLTLSLSRCSSSFTFFSMCSIAIPLLKVSEKDDERGI